MRTIIEGQRGCGWRKEGGLYLMADGVGVTCEKLPIVCEVCPTCGGGVKPTRGWTWVNPTKLAEGKQCKKTYCNQCAFGGKVERAGLLWIGRAFYETPQAWLAEVSAVGVSRRIRYLPKGFVAGETWVVVAHRQTGIPCGCAVDAEGKKRKPRPACKECKGGGMVHGKAIFHGFKPSRVEYVVKGDETAEQLERMEKRGIEPVKVLRQEQQELGKKACPQCGGKTETNKGNTICPDEDCGALIKKGKVVGRWFPQRDGSKELVTSKKGA